MANWITAFFMAWGNFLVIPCPHKKWDSKLNNLMLATLPAIGLVIGTIGLLIMMLLRAIGFPVLIQALIMTLYFFGISGFMHMDGFMDCADAIMSRRDQAERIRILKDPNRGAFAMIAAIMMILGMFVFITIYLDSVRYGIELIPLILVPVISRGKAGDDVIIHKPIGVSQYADTHQDNNKKYRLTMAVQVIIIIIALLIPIWNFDDENLFVTGQVIGPLNTPSIYVCWLLIMVLVATSLAAEISGTIARKSLGGMNGDIAGAEICWAELISMGAISIALYFISNVEPIIYN